MKLDVICNDGSPIGVTEASIFGTDGKIGLGGAELFLLTLCRAWHDAGHKVRLYNSPKYPNKSAFEQLPIDFFEPEDKRDAVIIFRSPNKRLTANTKGLKIWLSTDQSTVGDFKGFAWQVDKIVTISNHHAKHFKTFYGIENTITIDIPVRIWEYEEEIEKVPYRCLFNHIPDRGVMELHAAWAQIARDVPEASLVITSDWRLWDEFAPPEAIQKYKLKYARLPGVTYLGAINRKELIKHQLEAQVNLYGSIYPELFCISVAENQVAKCYPITSDSGALPTTNMGSVIPGNPQSPEWRDEFVSLAVKMLKDQKRLATEATKVQKLAKKRFSLDRILEEWDRKVFL